MSEKEKLIPADLAQVILLEKLLKEIRHVAKQNDENTPEGIVEPLHPIVVTTSPANIPTPTRKNWFSVSIVNDGPNICNVIVNTEKSSTTPYTLNPNETEEVDMGSAKIVDLRVWTDVGTASLRIKGVR